MKILRKLDEIHHVDNPVVTIGTFDGIHLGHQQILKHLFEKKIKYSGNSYLITFEPHPQLVLKSKNFPIKILTTLEEKAEIIVEYNIDYLLVLEFTKELSKMTGEEFIEEILLNKIGLIDVVIGYDHAFGYQRSGNIKTLKKYSEKYGFNLNVVKPYNVNKQIIKSTLIRQLIINGEIDLAKQFLGRPYQLQGKVVAGKGRGKKLSFPTANLELNDPNKLLPGDGIYAVHVEIENKSYNGAVSIGVRPTFDELERTIEAYLFDFEENIYGKNLTAKFIKKLRNEEKFRSVEDLISQMNLDVIKAKKVLSQI